MYSYQAFIFTVFFLLKYRWIDCRSFDGASSTESWMVVCFALMFCALFLTPWYGLLRPRDYQKRVVVVPARVLMNVVVAVIVVAVPPPRLRVFVLPFREWP